MSAPYLAFFIDRNSHIFYSEDCGQSHARMATALHINKNSHYMCHYDYITRCFFTRGAAPFAWSNPRSSAIEEFVYNIMGTRAKFMEWAKKNWHECEELIKQSLSKKALALYEDKVDSALDAYYSQKTANDASGILIAALGRIKKEFNSACSHIRRKYNNACCRNENEAEIKILHLREKYTNSINAVKIGYDFARNHYRCPALPEYLKNAKLQYHMVKQTAMREFNHKKREIADCLRKQNNLASDEYDIVRDAIDEKCCSEIRAQVKKFGTAMGYDMNNEADTAKERKIAGNNVYFSAWKEIFSDTANCIPLWRKDPVICEKFAPVFSLQGQHIILSLQNNSITVGG